MRKMVLFTLSVQKWELLSQEQLLFVVIHISTHGAFGSIAFGIGTSEVEMVLATQCLMQVKTKDDENYH